MRFLFLLLLFFLPSCQPKSQGAQGVHDAKIHVRSAPLIKNTAAVKNVPQRSSEALIASKADEPEKMNYIICLDAGHGGYDPGTKRKKLPLLCEKSLALDLALSTQKVLLPMGYKVILTRKSDLFISLPDRVLFAQKNKAILFVSFHCNWAKNTVARGVEVLYFEKKNDLRSSLSKKAAQFCLRNILSSTSLPSRKVKHGNLYVIRETPMPAILIEAGFFSNREDVIFLKQKANRNKLAQAIAKGIDEFCKL
jgi:N-acetylmuramoyl-L-alanine amidase